MTHPDLRAARRVITDARLVAFLRAVRDEPAVFAVQLINEDLDRARNLDAIFGDSEEPYGYGLEVRRRGDDYEIDFGCQAGPMAGDGGTWLIAFAGETVATATCVSRWIS